MDRCLFLSLRAADVALSNDSEWPEDLAKYFGVSVAENQEWSKLVDRCWRTLFTNALLRINDVAEALRSRQMETFFSSLIEQYAKPNPPLWSSIPEVSGLSSVPLENIRFDTTYDVEGTVENPTFLYFLTTTDWRDIENPTWLQHSLLQKEEGNKLFLAGKYQEALDTYSAATKSMSVVPFPAFARPLMSILLSNGSQCCLNMEKWSEARRLAAKAVIYDPLNSKAQARQELASQKILGKLNNMERASRVSALQEQCANQ